MIKYMISVVALVATMFFFSCNKQKNDILLKDFKINKESFEASLGGASNSIQQIPLYGNAYFSYKPTGAKEVLTTYNGLANWTNAQTVTSLDVDVPYQGTLKLRLNLKVAPEGKNSTIRVTVDGVSKDLNVSGGTFHDVDAGEFIILSPKKVKIDFQGISKSGSYFADLLKIGISGTAINGHGIVYNVPLGGNAFITSGTSATISDEGLINWRNATTITSAYFKANATGNASIKLNAKVDASGNSSVVKVTINGETKDVNIAGSNFSDFFVGDFPILEGYNKVDIQGVSKTGRNFGEVASIKVGSDAVANGALFCNDEKMYYWARRGPSCHLGYNSPNEDITYYYSEIDVPEGQDPIGSYFMTIGFDEGYFGIQVNSTTERRVLFSVWSPYVTDNPESIPADQRVLLNKKGSEVVVNDFGGEGSGGQSYLRYNWVAGSTYKFLLKGQPDGNGKTDFTAWFFAPEEGYWQLIASFKRPDTHKYLKGFYSFVESYIPENGYLQRSANFKNQWVRTKAGVWKSIQRAGFTVDDTYNKNHRIDATGGVNNSGYYLKNGGFFNNGVQPGINFTFINTSSAPTINLTTLP